MMMMMMVVSIILRGLFIQNTSTLNWSIFFWGIASGSWVASREEWRTCVRQCRECFFPGMMNRGIVFYPLRVGIVTRGFTSTIKLTHKKYPKHPKQKLFWNGGRNICAGSNRRNLRSTPPKLNIDTRNHGFLKCFTLHIWRRLGYIPFIYIHISMLDFRG